VREWNERSQLRHRYSGVNGIENRAEGEKLAVNYLGYEQKYRNRWITNHAVNSGTVRNLVDCGRA
jgi:hypothetical protein